MIKTTPDIQHRWLLLLLLALFVSQPASAYKIKHNSFTKKELATAQLGGLYIEGYDADSAFLTMRHKMLGGDWYIGFMGGISHSLSENMRSDYFFRSRPTIEFTLGATLTRCFGLRLNAGISPQMGFADETVRQAWPERYEIPYRFNMLNAYFDGLLDFTNIFSTKYTRPTFDVYGVLGFGLVSTYHFQEGKLQTWRPYYIVDSQNRTYMAGHAGLMTSYRFTQHWDWIIEGTYNFTDDGYNGVRSGTLFDTYLHIKTGLVYHFYNRREQMRINAASMGSRTYGNSRYYHPLSVRDEKQAARRAASAPIEAIPFDEVNYGQPLQTGIRFYLDRYFIAPSQSRRMAYIQRFLEAHPEVDLTVMGYGDNERGDTRFSEALAHDRAMAVRDTLVIKYGVDSARLRLDWQPRPLAPFSTLRGEWVTGVEFIMEQNAFRGRPDPDQLVLLHDWQMPEQIYGKEAQRAHAEEQARLQRQQREQAKLARHLRKQKQHTIEQQIKRARADKERRFKEMGASTYYELAMTEQQKEETASRSGDTLLTRIDFYIDRTYLTQKQKLRLDHVAKYLSMQKDINLIIYTYPDSDDVGESFNLWLSRTRAETIREYLVDFRFVTDSRLRIVPMARPLRSFDDSDSEWFTGAVMVVE